MILDGTLYDSSCQRECEEFEGHGQNVEEFKYAWLREIAVGKNNYPDLEHVFVEEIAHYPSEQVYSRYTWYLPTELEADFHLSGISVEVVLRRPIKVGPRPTMRAEAISEAIRSLGLK